MERSSISASPLVLPGIDRYLVQGVKESVTMSGSIPRDFLTSIDNNDISENLPPLGGGVTSFIKIYHDYVYFLGLSPFRLVFIPTPLEPKVQGGGVFQVKRWWPQTLFCGVITLLGFTWIFRDIRLSLPREPPGAKANDTGSTAVTMKNPTVYFVIMLQVAGSVLKLTVIRVFWGKQQQVCDILNFLCCRKPLSNPSDPTPDEVLQRCRWWTVIRKQRSILVFLVCTVYTAVAMVNWVLGRGLSELCYEGPLINRWNGGWWWAATMEAGRYNFFLESRYLNGIPGSGSFTKGDTFLGVISALGFYYRRVVSSHCNCFLLMAIHTLLTCTQEFSGQLAASMPLPSLTPSTPSSQASGKVSPSLSWTTVNRRYQAIKQLTKLINSVYGWNITLFLVEAILYYAVSFDDIFVEHNNDNDITKVLRLVFYFGSSCAVLFSAAEVSRQMITFKEWLSVEGHRKQIPLDHLHVTLNELDTHVVAIKGNNVFPVTFALAAKLLGVTVTYFIICVQT